MVYGKLEGRLTHTVQTVELSTVGPCAGSQSQFPVAPCPWTYCEQTGSHTGVGFVIGCGVIMAKGEWTSLGKEKLASSGLTVKQAEALGMREVVSAHQLHKSFEALPALVLPYHGFDGQPFASHPKWPNFYRVRYLAKGNSFKDLATEKSQRYAQEPGSGICAYFPRILDWDKIVEDVKKPIVITEGELKAAAACAQGFNCIGLGGVWNFKAMRDGVLFLPELARIEWVKRVVYICYDSDYVDKPQVCFAINSLAEELEERGAVVKVAMLPEVEGNKKTGLDDYFLQHNVDDFQDLLDQAPRLGIGQALWDINREVLYVEDPGLIVVHDTGQKLDVGKFKEHSRWAALNTVEVKLGAKGELVRTKVSAAPVWVKWPLRRFVSRVTYAPGQPKITESNEYNNWNGWGVKPKQGDVKPFLKLFDFIFADVEPDQREWVLDWMAYPIQNPGVKMFAAVVVHGVAQGTGKSLIGYTLGQIYGTNFKEITNDDLEDGQTWWAENKQFIMGDEITGNDNRAYASMLKRLVTQEAMKINIKFIPQFEIPDCINYYFTAQHGDAFFLEDHDRRYFVCEVTQPPMIEQFYKNYDYWRKHQDGPAHLMHWLLNRKISNKFNPYAHAPDTRAKRRMILAGKGELSRWVHDMLENTAHVIVSGQMRHARDLFTSNELLSMYKTQYPDGKATVTGMGRALSNAGCPQVAGGAPLRAPDGSQGRYYAVRNRERWAKATDRKKMEANIAMPPVRRSI
jgi:hypothetical protein